MNPPQSKQTDMFVTNPKISKPEILMKFWIWNSNQNVKYVKNSNVLFLQTQEQFVTRKSWIFRIFDMFATNSPPKHPWILYKPITARNIIDTTKNYIKNHAQRIAPIANSSTVGTKKVQTKGVQRQ